MNEEIQDESSGMPVRASDVESLIDEILATDAPSKWQKNMQLELGTKRWRPSAVADSGGRMLYVCLQQEVPQFVADRLRLCKESGIAVTVALPIASLFDPDVLGILVEVDADVFVVDDYRKERRYAQRHCLAAIADIEVPVSPKVRQSIALSIWSRIGDGTSQEKGKRLEALLAFVFSQVHDLKVVERNFRNESEEIDLVLQIDNFSTRAWQKPGTPFILVEAKNRADKASQQMMSVLLAKLQTKRGTAKIGILASLAGFTEDAKLQELRYSTSTQEICVVMIDRDGLEALLTADDLDEALETIVRRALLR